MQLEDNPPNAMAMPDTNRLLFNELKNNFFVGKTTSTSIPDLRTAEITCAKTISAEMEPLQVAA